MTPEGSRHAAVMDIAAHHLQRVFGSDFYVRIQHPLAVDDYSEPEPDIAVVRGAAHDYLDAHPTAAVLIVEISNESLPYDRTVKQRLYARCGIPEYWILAPPGRAPRDPPRPGWRRLPERHPPCSRRQGRAARSPRHTTRRRRSPSLRLNLARAALTPAETRRIVDGLRREEWQRWNRKYRAFTRQDFGHYYDIGARSAEGYRPDPCGNTLQGLSSSPQVLPSRPPGAGRPAAAGDRRGSVRNKRSS